MYDDMCSRVRNTQSFERAWHTLRNKTPVSTVRSPAIETFLIVAETIIILAGLDSSDPLLAHSVAALQAVVG